VPDKNTPTQLSGSIEQGASSVSTIALFVFFVVFVGLASSFLSSRANAQAAALANDPATLAAQAEQAQSQDPFLYSGQLLIETTRSADEAEPISYGGWYQLTASAIHKKSAVNATLKAGYTREYSYVKEDGSAGAFDNPSLVIAKSFRSGKDYSLSWLDTISVSVSGSLGSNNESRRRTFLWSNGIGITGGKAIGQLNLRQGFGYTHSFFEYDIRDNGTINSPNTLRSSTIAMWSLNDHFSLGASFIYGYSLSYQGVGRVTTMAQFSAEYVFTEKISASLGVASERGTLEPDGQTNRIRFYAPEAATYFLDLMVSL
jgi:hypothetical protein